jgi:2,3-diphosphopglycerate-independent phosphoglycerate mutase
MSLFGYDPRLLYRGRGAFESMGAGMEMLPGDIAFKSNFAVIDEETGVVLKRRADRSFEHDGPILCQDLNGLKVPGFDGEYTIFVQYATEHRCGVVIRGPGLTDAIKGTDPLKDNLPLVYSEAVHSGDTAAELTARVVNAASDHIRSILREHPVNKERREQGKHMANVILLRGCGGRIYLEEFSKKHGFEHACMVAPTKIIAGVGMCTGMTILNVPGATGDYRSNFTNKAKAMCAAIQENGYDFGFLHVKAVDDASHDANTLLKISCIEVVDAMVGQLIRMLYERGIDAVIGITGDHSTPVEYGDHSHEPVPFAMSTVERVVSVLGSPEDLALIPLDCLPCPEDLLLLSMDECTRWTSPFPWKKHLQEKMNRAPPSGVDGVIAFSEIQASQGSLGRFPGSFVIPTLQKLNSLA